MSKSIISEASSLLDYATRLHASTSSAKAEILEDCGEYVGHFQKRFDDFFIIASQPEEFDLISDDDFMKLLGTANAFNSISMGLGRDSRALELIAKSRFAEKLLFAYGEARGLSGNSIGNRVGSARHMMKSARVIMDYEEMAPSDVSSDPDYIDIYNAYAAVINDFQPMGYSFDIPSIRVQEDS